MNQLLCFLFLLLGAQGFSQKISTLYEQVNKAVVLIKTAQTEIIYEEDIMTMTNHRGYGSGFIISKQGDILTASHLVQTAEKITVVFADGEEVNAKVLYSYPIADVALIRLLTPKSTPLYIAKMGDSDQVKIGDQIFIIGAPYGLKHSLSVGYISGKYKHELPDDRFLSTEFFQSDAAINQGSSGGPMFNMKGEVIGIASFILSRSKGFQGLGFATSSNIAKKILLEDHAIWTGLEVNFIFGPLAEILNMPQNGGLLVQKVAKLSPGNDMGLRGGRYEIIIEGETLILGGDIILAIEEIPLINEHNLLKAWRKLQTLKPGNSLNITILRKGKIIELTKEIKKNALTDAGQLKTE